MHVPHNHCTIRLRIRFCICSGFIVSFAVGLTTYRPYTIISNLPVRHKDACQGTTFVVSVVIIAAVHPLRLLIHGYQYFLCPCGVILLFHVYTLQLSVQVFSARCISRESDMYKEASRRSVMCRHIHRRAIPSSVFCSPETCGSLVLRIEVDTAFAIECNITQEARLITAP